MEYDYASYCLANLCLRFRGSEPLVIHNILQETKKSGKQKPPNNTPFHFLFQKVLGYNGLPERGAALIFIQQLLKFRQIAEPQVCKQGNAGFAGTENYK